MEKRNDQLISWAPLLIPGVKTERSTFEWGAGGEKEQLASIKKCKVREVEPIMRLSIVHFLAKPSFEMAQGVIYECTFVRPTFNPLLLSIDDDMT